MSLDNGDLPKPDLENGSGPTSKQSKQATKKIIRVLTVMAYLSSVSMAAIMLSLYYIFLWHPPSSAQVMPQPITFYVPHIMTAPPDSGRAINGTLDVPEEPRAMPVQISEYSQNEKYDNAAQFHSDETAARWDDQDAYNILRKRSTRDIYEMLKISNAKRLVA